MEQITDGKESAIWTAIVGFAQARLRYPLLGHGGFLKFFDVTFLGAECRLDLKPNALYPGK